MQFFPYKGKIPHNTIQEEVLDAAFKLTKALQDLNVALYPIQDNKATTNALNKLANIFLQRLETDSPPRVAKAINTSKNVSALRVIQPKLPT